MTRAQKATAILVREFCKAFPRTIKKPKIQFDFENEEIRVFVGRSIWLMSISSDDDEFFFYGPLGEELRFPFPPDWLELGNE